MKEEKSTGFEKGTEIIGWIQIFLSPVFVSLALAALVYFSNPSDFRLSIAIVIILAGIFVGIRFANKIYQSKRGTINFLSGSRATEDEEPSKNK